MWNDVRIALRHLAAAKGFTITATLTLALGIGANTGIFTLIHALMLRSLPVADPQQIYRIGDGDNCCVLGGTQGRFSVYSYALYNHLREHTPEFEEMAAFQSGIGKVGIRAMGADVSEPCVYQFVSGNYFSLFGLRAFAGRLFQPSDDTRGAPPVAVMSYRLWQQRYRSDPGVIGSAFVIDGAPFTVIGIAPPGFFGSILRADPPDFWTPLAVEPVTQGRNSLLDHADNHWLYVMGRLKRGLDPAPVQAKVNVELHEWLNANLSANDGTRREIDKQRIAFAPGGGGVGNLKDIYDRDLRVLIGITGLVLLIACANLANLQLARGAANQAQTSIRVALGAPRSRLIRQVLVESTILSIIGGALGLLVAMQTSALLIRLSLRGASYVPIETTPSLPVLGFAFLLSLITGVVFGLAPAWSGSRADPAAALHGVGRSATGRRSTALQKTMVILQAALSLVLLAGAGLMVQTLRNLTGQQFGFQMEGNVVVDLNAGFAGYAPAKLASIYSEIDRQMRQIPGVRNVALTLYSPMSGNNWQMGATLEDHPERPTNPSWDRVSPTFFDTIGARILRGRGFDERDTPDSTHVAVVNQAFADAYYPNEDPLGKRFGLGGFSHRADYTIVGIVNTVRFRSPRGPGRPMFFLPLLQMWKNEWEDNTRARSNLIQSFVLRMNGNPADLVPRIQRTLGAIDPNLTMLNVTPITEMLDRLLAPEVLIGVLAQLFGVLALILASLGLYGITSHSVARRTSEIGIRTALGATRGQVVWLVLKDAMAQAGVGLLVGIPCALAAGRLLADQVYGVKTSDPVTLCIAAVLLSACAAIASAIPAIRASGVDPVTALRVDN
jgi:predicted permease